MLTPTLQIYQFGQFRLDATERRLLRDGEVVPLTPKVFDLLLVLVENSGHLVEKEELMKRVWPDSFVEEANLSVNMTALRRALGEGPNDHQYIETVPRRGYRFVASVNERCDDVVAQPGLAEAGKEKGQDPRGPAQQAAESRRGKITRRWLAVTGALAVLLVLLVGFNFGGWRERVLGVATPRRIESLAVLPLENLTGDPGQDHFADGMTEALTTELGKISGLGVISRTSVMRYKGAGKSLSLKEIAGLLEVDWVVEGAAQRAEGRVKITVQLIRAATDQHLWAQSYERDERDALALQSQVAREIANEINVKLSPREKADLARAQQVNPDAYEEFLWGLHFQNQFVNEQREEPNRKALKHFEQAIQIDPSFAPAYAHVTFCYGTLANRFGFRELIPKAKEAAMKAVQLDDTLPEAHGALAFVLTNLDWDWPGTERAFKRALELNPSYSWAHWGYANYLTIAARYEEALAENEQARKLQPVVLAPTANIGYIYLCMREYDRAIEQYRKALALSPNSHWMRGPIGFAYQCQGKYEEALAEYQKARDLSGNELEYRQALLSLYAMSGRRSDALKILNEFKKANWKLHTPMQVAEIYSLLGEKDQAIEWLEKAYAEHDSSLLTIRCNPELDSLSSDPRYQDLLRRIALP